MSSSEGRTEGRVSSRRLGLVGHLLLDHPEKKNAIDRSMAIAFTRSLEEMQHHPDVHVVVVSGRGGDLSSGVDLDDPAPAGGYAADPRTQMLRTIWSSPIPIIAAVDGWAIGLGLAILGASTFAVAGNAARFWLPEVDLGFFPFGMVPFVSLRAPVHRVLEWSLTGERFCSAVAAEAQLVTHLCQAGSAEATALELARRLARPERPILERGIRWAERAVRLEPEDLVAWSEQQLDTEPPTKPKSAS